MEPWTKPLWFDGFLSTDECAQLVKAAESHGFEPAMLRLDSGPALRESTRNNERAQIPGGDWRDLILDRILNLPLPSLDGMNPCGLPEDLRFYRYGPGQRFKMHKDGPWTEGGMTSKATFIVYLNEGFAGGHTVFRDGLDARPATGAAIAFPHATWHEGQAVESGIKHVLRTDVFYGPAP